MKIIFRDLNSTDKNRDFFREILRDDRVPTLSVEKVDDRVPISVG